VPTDPPRPKRNRWNTPFWEACDAHRLIAQRCDASGRLWLPPGPVSPFSRDTRWSWKPLAGTATVETWARMHQRYYPDFPEALPYNVIQVRLDEGPAWISNLVSDDDRDPEIGMRVQVRFVDYGQGEGRWSYPKFAPLE
jgi:uncharacterized OB-fold protein